MVSTLDFWIGGESGKRINDGDFLSNLIWQQHSEQAKRHRTPERLKK